MQGDAATEEDDQRKWDQEQASSFLAAFHQHGTSDWQKARLYIAISLHAHLSLIPEDIQAAMHHLLCAIFA